MAEKAKNDAIKKVVCVADLLVEAMNGGVKELFISESELSLKSEHWLPLFRASSNSLISGCQSPIL